MRKWAQRSTPASLDPITDGSNTPSDGGAAEIGGKRSRCPTLAAPAPSFAAILITVVGREHERGTSSSGRAAVTAGSRSCNLKEAAAAGGGTDSESGDPISDPEFEPLWGSTDPLTMEMLHRQYARACLAARPPMVWAAGSESQFCGAACQNATPQLQSCMHKNVIILLHNCNHAYTRMSKCCYSTPVIMHRQGESGENQSQKEVKSRSIDNNK